MLALEVSASYGRWGVPGRNAKFELSGYLGSQPREIGRGWSSAAIPMIVPITSCVLALG